MDLTERLQTAVADRYRIERELGEGGMATVYLAEDLKHDRQVAIKVLKPDLAAVVGAERFLAEIRTTASLQHPGILPLHDSGEADSFLYYVMPYVEGESLRERLDREHQLPVDEAVRIATDVAEALDYAHRHGVIHRDVKPANILLVAGRPVLSDFGIALAVGAAGGGRLTETGLSLGTPHYMSPEQATGDAHVGPATDVYALGCVLYEMLTGDPPHTGSTAQAVLGKIIMEPPVPIGRQRKSVPPNVEATVARALEKLPADRFGSAGDFARALADPGFRHGAAASGSAVARRPWNRLSVGLAAVAALMTVVAAALAVRPGRPGTVPAASSEIRFTIPIAGDDVYLGGAGDATFGRPSSTSIALSPDGRLLIYAGWKKGTDGRITSRLYRRPLDQEQATPIPGTEAASSPFFSPDGKWIAFFAGGSLKRVPVAGGNVETVAQEADVMGEGVRGASWSEDGTVVYGGAFGVYRVAATGGEPELIAAARVDSSGSQRDSTAYPWYTAPLLLPGGHTLLFDRVGSPDADSARIIALDLASGRRTALLADAMDPLFMQPDDLLFLRRGTLMEVGFDPGALRVEGQPRVRLSDVMQAVYMPNDEWGSGVAQLAVSRSGDLAYVPGGLYPEPRDSVFRVARDGHATSLGWAPRQYLFPRVSPDGQQVAFSAGPGTHVDLYVRDLARGVTRRLDTGGYSNFAAAWSPDGQSILFSLERGATSMSYRVAADGSGTPVRIAASDRDQQPSSWSTRGVIAYLQLRRGQFDIWTLAPGGEPTPFVATDAEEVDATFSPNGRWLAYTSDESGRDEIYVRPYSRAGAAIMISANGGDAPAWSPDGRHLYYIQGRASAPVMMVADVVSRTPLRFRRARILIDPWNYDSTVGVRNYDILPDGSFIAVRLAKPAEDRGLSGRAALRDMYRVGAVHVIVNFLDGSGGGRREHGS